MPAVVTILPNGLTIGTIPKPSDHERGKRGTCRGWTARTARGNRLFLYSVQREDVTGDGWSVTLTMRDCPPSPPEFHKVRRAMERRLQRMGAHLGHYVIEWQRRGVPHLHLAVFFDTPSDQPHDRQSAIIRAWLDVCPWGALKRSQHAGTIYDSDGWARYLAKHAARGAAHYQRSNQHMPEAWQGNTGRMWGKWGAWPIADSEKFDTPRRAGWIFRRWLKSRIVAEARQDLHQVQALNPSPRNVSRVLSARRRLARVRRMLKCNKRNAAEVMPMTEFINEDVSSWMLFKLADAYGMGIHARE